MTDSLIFQANQWLSSRKSDTNLEVELTEVINNGQLVRKIYLPDYSLQISSAFLVFASARELTQKGANLGIMS